MGHSARHHPQVTMQLLLHTLCLLAMVSYSQQCFFVIDNTGRRRREAGAPVPQAVVEEEQMAFQLCDTDHMAGLSWAEVEECEAKYAVVLMAAGIEVPSHADFNDSDLNQDGTLMFEEWLTAAESQ